MAAPSKNQDKCLWHKAGANLISNRQYYTMNIEVRLHRHRQRAIQIGAVGRGFTGFGEGGRGPEAVVCHCLSGARTRAFPWKDNDKKNEDEV